MTHDEAEKILEQADGQYSQFGKDMDSVILEGTYTINQLRAVLQLMEYTA